MAVSYSSQCEEYLRQCRLRHQWTPDEEDMNIMLQVCHRFDDFETTCQTYLRDIRYKADVNNPVKVALRETLGASASLYYFVTINYPAELTDLHRIKEITTNINKLEWIESIEYVYEFYTKSGGHPHCHMLIIPKEKMPKSRVIDKIFAVKGLKKLVPGKQAIDVADNRDKTIQDYRNYINGAKRESKTGFVAQDIEWRQLNGLE